MSMRTLNAAYKAVCVVGGFLFICVLTVPAQRAERDSRLESLFSSDPAIHGAAKTALLEHPDPTMLPALLQAVQAATGTTRDDLLEILAKYDDSRKIPVLLAMVKKSLDSGGGTLGIDEQLSRLGAPAAEALLANCPNQDNYYPYWAGGVLGLMHQTGARFLIQAVQSDDVCQHSVGDYGLSFMFGDADPNAISRADLQLAVDAAIDKDERIRLATRRWLASLNTKEQYIDFSGIVDELISVYQSGVPSETMVKIAGMLSQPERPRVTRFMRAAVHAPNPEIRPIANQYLSQSAQKDSPHAGRVSSHPRTLQETIDFIGQLTSSREGDVNAKLSPFISDSDAKVRAAAASALGEVNAPSGDVHDARQIYPETALPALRRALQDSSPLVRAAAAESLGDIRSNDDLALLAAALEDSDTSVALSAAKAIQQIPNDSAVPPLTRIYRDEKSSPELRRQVLSTLETIGSPDSISIFLEDLRSGGKKPSLTAAWALQGALEKHPDPTAFEPIRKALEEAQPPWPREVLVVALGATRNPLAFEVLVPILESQSPILRPKAADALGLLGDRRAIPILTGLLKDPDYQVRESAAFALTRFANFPASPELVAALRDTDTTVQLHASGALLQSHDPKAIDALIAAMPNPNAIYALGESHDSRAVPALITFLKNPANQTADRAAAAASLGKLGDLHAVEPLIASLNEDNAAIEQQASSALGTLKDKRAIEPLKQAYARWSAGQLENADSVRNSFVQALLELGVTDVVQGTTGVPAH
ncbi:MAG: HEAT repeat domain-containing protein [Acidobacteriia bacterium]|nr:HEAT repeat domain-containing protein [Terriglobia bacterium]